MDNWFEKIKQAVIAGRHADIEDLDETAVQNQANLDDLVNKALIGGMDVVGERFGSGQRFVPEMLVSAMTLKKGLNIIKPLPKEGESRQHRETLYRTTKLRPATNHFK